MLFVGAAAAFYGLLTIGPQLWSAKHWITTTANITNSHIQVTSYRGGYQYLPQVQYSFTANGKVYYGRDISIPNFREVRESDAMNKLAPYPINADVNVYFDPQNPNHSALIRPIFDWGYLLFIFSTGSLMVALSVFLFRTGLYLV